MSTHTDECLSPVYAGDVDDHIDHIAAELVGLHVHRGAVGGDVNFTDDVKQEGFLDPGVLQNTRRDAVTTKIPIQTRDAN